MLAVRENIFKIVVTIHKKQIVRKRKKTSIREFNAHKVNKQMQTRFKKQDPFTLLIYF